MKSSKALSSLRSFLDQQGGSVSSPSNTWPTEPRIFCSKFLAPGEGNQTCQVRGGTSPLPPFHLWTIILELWALNGH